MKRILLILTGFSLFAPDGRCCGVCTDQMLAMSAPWIVPVFLVYLGWVIVSLFLHTGTIGAVAREIEIFPSSKRAFRLLWITPLVVVILWILLSGSVKAPMLLIVAVWLPAIVIRTILFGLKGAERHDKRQVRLRRIFLSFQYFSILLAGLTIPISTTLAHTPASLAANLSYRYSGLRDVMRQLIDHGEAAVEPLIATAQRELGHSEKVYTLGPALYCLGEIGGGKATSYLEGVVRDRVRFENDDPLDIAWQRTACFAYARAAGAGAARELIALYQRCDRGKAPGERWAILTALVISGGQDSLRFVWDHIDDLLDKADPGKYRAGDLAGAAVAALLTVEQPEMLRDLPTLRASELRGMIDRPTAEEYRDARLARINRKDYSLRSVWREREKAARERLINAND